MAFAPRDSSPAHHLHYQEPHDSTLSDDASTTGPSAIGIPKDLGEERARNDKPTPSNLGYGTYEGRGLKSSAKLTDDGRILISLDLQRALLDLPKDYANPVKEYAVDTSATTSTPPMNVVIMIVGSRGDVQPYIAFGLAMQKYGHRVRIASHENFRKMVKDAKLEFYPIGGDPAELMSYMVKNPGLLPGFESLVNGDIPKKRRMLAEILDGCWKACYLPDDETGQPFLADAIISNPPAFAHIHCAEALGIPLQLSFTYPQAMPWCATIAFHHPLVQVGSSNAEHGLTNYLSYALADLLQWQGLGDVINRYRTKTLGLEPLSLTSGPSVTDRLKIPWTYCFSPSLIPKPKDWMNHIDIVGFYFLEAGKTYTPDADLLDFLNQGDPPIYIGFGSVVVEDAPGMTRTIFDGVQKAGVRAIVSAGWGGLGGTDVPPNIFILSGHPGVPHDWLFTEVSAVCHHGGAGTTAIGLLLGKPTIVVPFFGDQPFWGRMVHEAGAGPAPIPQQKLSVDSLVDAIKFCLTPQARGSAQRLADKIKNENGQEEGLKSFHAHLPLLNMRCDLDPSRVAVWWSTELCLKLSAFAAQVLADARRLEWDDLDLHRPKEYDTRKQASDPITGDALATFWTGTHFRNEIAQIFDNPTKSIANAMAAIPRGCAKIFESAYEGFRNMPKLYGSDVREVGPVRDFRSGLREGGKGFAYGIYDGITGLVTEPIRGAREEGFMGAIKGSGRSFINASMRPAAGTLALVAQPTRGLWKSAQRRFTRRHDIHLRESRRWEGHEATRKSPDLERESQAILQAFVRAKGTVKQRRDSARDEGRSSAGGLTLEGTVRSSSPEPLPLPSSSSPPALPSRPSGAVSSQTQAQMSVDGEEEAFQRDLELAIQLSRKEQEEHERALASIPSERSTGPSELVTTGEDGLLK